MIVRPSEIHTYAYCPRMLFFELTLGRPRPISERLRLLLGRLFHASFRLRDLVKGFRSEEPLLASIGSVELRGRADALKVSGGTAYVIERKSSRPPNDGVWASDALQAAAYALALVYGRGVGERPDVTIEIRYPSGGRTLKFDDELAALAIRAIDDISLLKRGGIVPYAKRGRRCERCPFRELCYSLDFDLNGEPFEDPLGSWLRDVNVVGLGGGQRPKDR